MKLEKKFHETIELPELEKRKEELKRIRKIKSKPLSEIELKHHEHKYEILVRQRMAELEEERMRKLSNIDFDPQKFATKTNQRVWEEDEYK